MRDSSGRFSHRRKALQMCKLLATLFILFSGGNVDCRTHITHELAVESEARYSRVHNPAVFPVVAPKPIFHLERPMGVERRTICVEAILQIVGMHTLRPPVSDFLVEAAARKRQPGLVE